MKNTSKIREGIREKEILEVDYNPLVKDLVLFLL